MRIERLSTGIREFDELIAGGIPRGFFVAVTGEPGTGKTVFCLHFAAEGIRVGDKVIYVSTEESRESIVRQAAMFGWDFEAAERAGKLIIIDALMRDRSYEWSLSDVTVEELVAKVIEAKRRLGYGRARLIVDSMSAFWLDRPVMARKYSYHVKRILSKWDFTALLVSQYSITTESAFGFGIEHVADGIVRFKKAVEKNELKRYIIVEKMRQTPHDLRVHEIDIVDGRGMVIKRPTPMRREDLALPEKVARKLAERRQATLAWSSEP